MAIKALFLSFILSAAAAFAQTTPPQVAPPTDSPITQMRRSVTFIKLNCSVGNQTFEVRGTGFFVFYPEPTLGANRGFLYLITNRHVALCSDEAGHSMQVKSISIMLNRKQALGDVFAQEIFLNPYGNAPWVVPEDESVDLAALPILIDQSMYDFTTIPISMLASKDILKQRGVSEGEPVTFTGFFYQFPGQTRMEPIVREGIIAMMPTDKVPFQGMGETVYLADLHVFGGNSGSPVFFNLGGFRGGSMIIGAGYELLGVVNGEVTEDENFNLQLSTTLRGKGAANSGIGTIVPAEEILELLNSPELQKKREVAKAVASGRIR